MEKSMRTNCKMEYLWLDGYETPNIRSKTRYMTIESEDGSMTVKDIPEWGFDGSSTEQASGNDSDCILKPVSIFLNPVDSTSFPNSYLVLCEVFNKDGTPHPSNHRSSLREACEGTDDLEMWLGIEQEYTVMDPEKGRPYGWPDMGYPQPQGRYYCGVGGDVVKMRDLAHQHAMCCLDSKIPLCGANAEVMLSQWEYQIGPASPTNVCDYLWVSRYILEILAESVGASISLDPKLIKGDWNGSGAHINFSTKFMREVGGKDYIDDVCNSLGESHEDHIANYGVGNEQRLTGTHETQHINEFTYGESDRGASIRIPHSTAEGHKGYLEDRRPASNMDPYKAVRCLVETMKQVDSKVEVEV
tara:strand:+ start:9444 stop:10520 length:1077 start_codon:yes stop_codon:yes gene_type:complete